MSFNYKTDTVIGYLESKKGSDSAQFAVLGYRNINDEYTPSNLDFSPNGKVFCPSFFAIESIPSNAKNYETVFIFSCSESYAHEADSLKDLYSVNIHEPINCLPRMIELPWTEEQIGLGDQKFENLMSDDNTWFAYPYNSETKILFEVVKFEDGKFSPFKGKEIGGYTIIDSNFIQFKVPTNNRISYFFPELLKPLKKKKPEIYLDFMTRSQLKGWIKELIKEYSKLDEDSSKQLRTLVNSLPVESGFLHKIRLARAKDYLQNISLTNKELKLLLASNSSVGKELQKQISTLRNDYESEWRKEFQSEFYKIEKNFETKRSILNTEIKSIEMLNASTLNALQLKQSDLDTLIDSVKKKAYEVQELEKHKELIFSLAKGFSHAGINSSGEALLESFLPPIHTCKKVEIYTVANRKIQFDPNSSRYDDIEDFLVSSLKKKITISDKDASVIVDVLKLQSSFIPSVSWAYILANLVGNSNVMTLTVEYDWLHYKDFSRHGLHEYWETAHNHPEITYFLVIQNINMVPSECSLLPFLEVFSNVRPVLEGTGLGIPSNLYCLATVVSTKGKHAMGVPLEPELFQSWGAFLEPNNSQFKVDKSLCGLQKTVTTVQLNDSSFRQLNNEKQSDITKAKALYYDF